MAIFYEHIKGYYKNSGNGLWSWIKWVGSFTNGAVFANQPRLEIKNADADGNPTGSAIDFGHLITEKGEGQSIDKAFTFKKALSILEPLTISNNSLQGLIISYNQLQPSVDTFTLGNTGIISIASGAKFYTNNEGTGTTQATAPNVFLGGAYFDKGVNFNSNITLKGATFNDSITITGICNATSFNATSDYRAKKDIAQLDIQALPIIMDTPIYTFRYKKNDIPSVGVLAQDLAEINLTHDLTLVDNPKATGENNDFMTVKESKLVYILWKAIQEQQKQINYLKDLVTRLSK